MRSTFTIGAERNDYWKLSGVVLTTAIYCAVQIPLMISIGMMLVRIPVIGLLLISIVGRIPDVVIVFLSYKLINNIKLWLISLPVQTILYFVISFCTNVSSEKWYVLLFMVFILLVEQMVGVLMKKIVFAKHHRI